MRVRTSTSAKSTQRPNEDFVGVAGDTVVLLDGAGIRGAESICRHGTAWYVGRLGEALLARLADGEGSLTDALAAAIERVAGEHRSTCDLADPSSPQSTALIVRAAGGELEYLALGDSWLVVEQAAGAPLAITDPREVDVRAACAQLPPEAFVDELRSRRNQPGGYWIAKEDPAVARHAVTGRVPTDGAQSAALISNGASRIVDTYGLATWPAALQLLRAGGPEALIRRLRDAERAGPRTPAPDDATVAWCTELSV